MSKRSLRLYPGVCSSSRQKGVDTPRERERNFHGYFTAKLAPGGHESRVSSDYVRYNPRYGCVCHAGAYMYIAAQKRVRCRVSLAIFACYPQHEAVIPQDLAYTYNTPGGGVAGWSRITEG